MSSSSPSPSKSDASGENELTNCLLSQYRFSAAGVGLGTAYALRFKKGFMPMVAAGAIGTSIDMVYGYLVECARFREDASSSSGERNSSKTE